MHPDLPERSRPRRVAIPAAALAVLWLAMLMLGAGVIDEAVLRTLYAGDRPSIAAVARFLTFFGEGVVVVLLSVAAALFLLVRKHPRLGLALIGVTVFGRLLVWAQKYSIVRMRPEIEAHLVPVYSPSFPSAHSANSMIAYLTIAVVLTAGTRWLRPAVAVAFVFAICIGLSRVILGVHWPSDVVGGWSFGLLWVLLALPLAERVAARQPRR
ncbi:phosphatase PAP2 family protein [Sphingomonas sinipercae]|uniref:Phosphatase PAP2 family protein n=1 Tax=Sphingomonas sinipercae TaxID=2714944 RepID=A0A6G7ZPE8_9SPHN|nr:phosphatase PAP2 family protein [Sphingomonas sinipercae]QIL02805.1 phosphatase PAP2 family protein [Sphingomonas sinipercae]